MLAGKTVLVSAGEYRALATATLLGELGLKILAVRTFHHDEFAEAEYETLAARAGGDLTVNVANCQPFEEANLIRRLKPDVFLGHYAGNATASKVEIATHTIYHVGLNYVGYKGAYELAGRWLPELVVYTDQLEDEAKPALLRRHERIAEPLRPKVVFETDSEQIVRHFRELVPGGDGDRYQRRFSPAFVVGSSLDRRFATTIGAAHLSVSFPVANRAVLDRGYTGFSGGLRLVEDLLGTIVAGR